MPSFFSKISSQSRELVQSLVSHTRIWTWAYPTALSKKVNIGTQTRRQPMPSSSNNWLFGNVSFEHKENGDKHWRRKRLKVGSMRQFLPGYSLDLHSLEESISIVRHTYNMKATPYEIVHKQGRWKPEQEFQRKKVSWATWFPNIKCRSL